MFGGVDDFSPYEEPTVPTSLNASGALGDQPPALVEIAAVATPHRAVIDAPSNNIDTPEQRRLRLCAAAL